MNGVHERAFRSLWPAALTYLLLSYTSGFAYTANHTTFPFALSFSRGPESVGRLVVQSLGNAAWEQHQHDQQQQQSHDQQSQQQPFNCYGYNAREEQDQEEVWRGMAKMLLQLRMAVQDKRCAALVTCQACEYVMCVYVCVRVCVHVCTGRSQAVSQAVCQCLPAVLRVLC